MANHAPIERQLLCDDLERLGPDAPTMCEGWTTGDLAAHLYSRERRPHLALGAMVPVLKDRVEREQHTMGAKDYARLVSGLRQGPPRWNPLSLGPVDKRANTVEFFVHHEDARRAQPGWQKRELSADYERTLWTALRGLSRVLFRKAPTGVVLVAPDHGRHAAKKPGERGTVVVTGRPGELLLFAFGRGAVADVSLEGSNDDVAALKSGTFGY